MAKNHFDVAAVVEDITWQLRLADFPRSENRRRINDLFNGMPPFSEEEARQNNLNVNANFLESTVQAHDARRQFTNAFTKPGNFFQISVDRGPKHKRKEFGSILTRLANRPMKRSLTYFETYRSQFANTVLHGIGPVVWPDRYRWRPDPKGVEDIMIPGGTLLTMENLPFFAVFQPYTANQLRKLTTGPRVDPAWNMPLVNQLIESAERELLDFGIPNSEIYSPEKMAERIKSDAGFVSGDSVATIDAWEFYFWCDEGKQSGWRKRIVLDANWEGGVGGMSRENISKLKTSIGTRDEFLYNPGSRKYADNLSELISWQFGDLSAVGPFRYHSVRALGYLLFAPCLVYTRTQCLFLESLLEQLCQYFRVRNIDEVERALSVNLFNRAFLDESVQFIPAGERWQVNAPLIQMGLNHLERIIGRGASSYQQQSDMGPDNTPETATKTMAILQATTALVSAALAQAYEYKKGEYREICRRLCIKNSRDLDGTQFRKNALIEGVPEEVLDPECWDIEPERVMGGGNKTIETAVAERLLAVRPMLDPEPQRDTLRNYVLALSDDAALANRLVPESPVKVTNAVHDAQLTVASLMAGFQVDVQTGVNHIEIIETMLHEAALKMHQIEGNGAMANPEQIIGLQNVLGYIAKHIQILSQDKNEKQRVKEYGDALGNLGNLLKAYIQRLQQQMQKAQQKGGGNGGIDPETMAKIQALLITAKAKAENTRMSHSQRTAQRQVAFEMEQQRDAERHELDLQKKRDEHQVEMQNRMHSAHIEGAAELMRTGEEIHNNRLKAASEPTDE